MFYLGHAGDGGPGGSDPLAGLVSAAHLLPAAHAQGVILLAPVIGIEKLFEPLDEFEIILESLLH